MLWFLSGNFQIVRIFALIYVIQAFVRRLLTAAARRCVLKLTCTQSSSCQFHSGCLTPCNVGVHRVLQKLQFPDAVLFVPIILLETGKVRVACVKFLSYYLSWQVTVRCACQRLKKEWLCCDAQAAQPKGTQKSAVSAVGILPCDKECIRLANEQRTKEESEELRHRKSKEPEVCPIHQFILQSSAMTSFEVFRGPSRAFIKVQFAML